MISADSLSVTNKQRKLLMSESNNTTIDIDLLTKLKTDIRRSAVLLGRKEARFLVDQYYILQDIRIRAGNQRRQMENEPHQLIDWMFGSYDMLEKNLKSTLGYFAQGYAVGKWLQSICGVGPVISAGLLSHLDIRNCKTAGHFWRFAGLDPTQTWDKGQKRPWNGDLKRLCFLIGESFVKVQSNKNDFYGQLFAERKKYEAERNEKGELAEQAKSKLEKFRIGHTTDAYKAYSQGILPPAHIHARARRWTIKLFLSHVHHVMYLDYYGQEPVKPYAFEKCEGDHRHYISPPNLPLPNGRNLKELLGEEKVD